MGLCLLLRFMVSVARLVVQEIVSLPAAGSNPVRYPYWSVAQRLCNPLLTDRLQVRILSDQFGCVLKRQRGQTVNLLP
jgi:hypothetical protein